MSNNLELYIFGDQTFDAVVSLGSLLKQKNDNSFVLDHLFKTSCSALRREIRQLAPAVSRSLPSCDTIGSLITLKSRGTLHPAIEPALTCISHFGLFIS